MTKEENFDFLCKKLNMDQDKLHHVVDLMVRSIAENDITNESDFLNLFRIALDYSDEQC